MTGVFAIVVTHHPRSETQRNVRALVEQKARVIVVDNGSGPSSVLDELSATAGVDVVRLPLNLGIATGFNVGVKLAVARGAHWLFTFDQDSAPAASYVARMIASFEEAVRAFGPVGVLSPFFVDDVSGEPIEKASPTKALEQVRHAMSSGCLLKPETFEITGPFADELFLDFVDIEFCLRCRSKGLAVVRANGVALRHRLGSLRTTRFGALQLRTTNHPPDRVYYRTRNRVRMELRYGLTDPRWAVADLIQLAGDAAKIALEADRPRKLLATARGVIDGLRGVRGPLKR